MRSASSQLHLNFLRGLQQLKTEISHPTFNGTFRYVGKQFVTDLQRRSEFFHSMLGCDHFFGTKVTCGTKEKSVSFWKPKSYFIHLCARELFTPCFTCANVIYFGVYTTPQKGTSPTRQYNFSVKYMALIIIDVCATQKLQNLPLPD